MVAAQMPGAGALAITLAVPAGTTSETAGESGFAHLIEHLLHRYAVAGAGPSIERVVHASGGISNAQTYAFHTEFTFVVPRPADAIEVREWIDLATGRLAWPVLSVEGIEAEKRVIEREVRTRLASSPFACFPWKDALGALSHDFAFTHDGYAQLDDIDAADESSVQRFFSDNYGAGSSVVSVVSEFSLDDLMAAGVGGLRDLPTSARPRSTAMDGLGQGHRVDLVWPELAGWVRADVRGIPMTGDPTEARATAMVSAGVARKLSPECMWQSGLYGPEFGPDYSLLLAMSAGPDGSEDLPAVIPLAELSKVHALHEVVAEAVAEALTAYDRVLGATASFASLVARDILFGLRTYATREAIIAVDARAVLDYFEAAAGCPTGVVVRRGTARAVLERSDVVHHD
nr:insulinase family protein [Agreia sp. COWG]